MKRLAVPPALKREALVIVSVFIEPAGCPADYPDVSVSPVSVLPGYAFQQTLERIQVVFYSRPAERLEVDKKQVVFAEVSAIVSDPLLKLAHRLSCRFFNDGIHAQLALCQAAVNVLGDHVVISILRLISFY